MSPIVEYDKTIYLDHAATTPLDPEVLAVMMPYFDGRYGNASSMYASGRRSGQVLREARQAVAEILNALPEEIIFTGSGTEADNMAILGVARANRTAGDHIIISSIEHKAVTESAKKLEREGFSVSVLPVGRDGLVSVEACLALITSRTTLVSVMYANNEIGTIEPIRELADAVRKLRGANPFPLFHTDACQAAGALSLDVQELGVDLMSLNGSKIYGPKGVGALYKKRGVRIDPVIVGGEQEMSLRAGTESVPLIVGFAEALKRADDGREGESRRLSVLRDYLIERLRKEIPGLVVNGHLEKRLPNNVHVSIPHVEGESMLLMLDTHGIEAGTGSACSAHDLKPSHVLAAIGQDADLMHGSVRFSLGKPSTREQMDRVMEVFPEVVRYLTSISALTAITSKR
ncbi:MAG: cysteine desulfurase family protein [Candidatus Paceibacterota bacterium]|jgi:cysteine desulfurase